MIRKVYRKVFLNDTILAEVLTITNIPVKKYQIDFLIFVNFCVLILT